MAKGKKRKRQHRSPVPRAEQEFTPDDVLDELREVTALVTSARDKAMPKAPRDAVSEQDARHQLQAAYRGLLECDIYEIVPDMMREVRRVYNVRRNGTPVINASMMPCRSGYVFFDTLWPAPFEKARLIRSLSWTQSTIVTSDLGPVPSLQVIVYGPHYSSMYADILPLGDEYHDSWYKYGKRNMQALGHMTWSLWMMLNSELAATRRVRLEQPKEGPPRWRNIEHARYRVVALRRRQDPEGEPGHRDVDWQVRWWVSEHWRHLGKYEGAHHKGVPTIEDGQFVCLVCRGRGQVVRLAHIKSHPCLNDRTDLPWAATKPTVHKLVR